MIKQVLTCVLTVVLVIPCVAQEIEFQAELQAPEQCEVGQLVVLRIVASDTTDIEWGIRPLTDDFDVFENGRVAVFSGRNVGKYMVIAACCVDGTANLLIHELSVVDQVDTFEADVFRAAEDVEGYPDFEAKRIVLIKLESLFRTLSTEFANDEELNATVGKAIKELLGEDQPKWEPVFDVISEYLKEKFKVGDLDYKKVWTNVANALKRAAVPC